jgi:hypothetical protein
MLGAYSGCSERALPGIRREFIERCHTRVVCITTAPPEIAKGIPRITRSEVVIDPSAELHHRLNVFWAPRLVGIRADGALACIQTHNERLGDFLKRWQASLKEEGSRG